MVEEHTFLFCDLVGFTALTAAEGDMRGADVCEEFGNRVRPLLKEHRDARKPELIDLLGPLHLQNVRLIGRTLPGMSPSGSPSLVALGPWSDNGDGKLTATVHLHDGHVTVAVSKTSDTIEVLFATPRGMTPSEVMMALSLLRLPLDRESEAKFSTEVLRDGSSFTFGEARTPGATLRPQQNGS